MIKFRAWNQIDSEYINEINAVMSLDGSHIWWDINDSGEMKYEDDPGNYKLEQFTGLKDVNSNDIYTGDILEVTIDGTVQADKYLVKHVWDPHVWTEESDGYYAVSKMEVQGNVHENPELLEADK